MRVNENLGVADGRVTCNGCGTIVGDKQDTLGMALLIRGPVSQVGPGIRAGIPSFTSQEVEFRQYVCPNCHRALQTEVTSVEEAKTRSTRLR